MPNDSTDNLYGNKRISSFSVSDPESKDNGCCCCAARCLKFFLVVLFFLCIGLVIALLIVIFVLKPPEPCRTPDCFDAAAMMGASMNLSADPCEDFYEYVCGGWVDRNPLAADDLMKTQFTELGEKTDERVWMLLNEDLENEDLQNPVNIAKILYHQCLDLERLEKDGSAPLESAIADIGGWVYDGNRGRGAWNPFAWNLETAMKKAMATYGTTPMLSAGVGDDQKDPLTRRVQIAPAGLSLSSVEYYLDDDKTNDEAFQIYLATLAMLMGLDETRAAAFAKDVWDFEVQLAMITPLPQDEEVMDPNKNYNKMPFSQLKTELAYLDWTNLLDMFSNLKSNDDVIVSVKSYFEKLKQIFENANPSTLNNYVVSRLILNTASYLSKDFRQAQDDYKQGLSGVQPKPRQEVCVAYPVELAGAAVGAMYAKKYFSETSRKNVIEMIDDIREAFNEHVDKLDWMDDETKRLAKEKAEGLINSIGTPLFALDEQNLKDYYKGWVIRPDGSIYDSILAHTAYIIQRSNRLLNEKRDVSDAWEGNAAEINAYYSPVRNTIIFPAAFMQRPFYDERLPLFVNYAAIGSVIGHELTHAFDDSGANYDSTGSLKKWWTDGSWEAFKRKTQCFVDYYENYEVDGYQVRGRLTLGENIADVGGLGLAWDAFQKRRKEMKTKDVKPLPGIPLDVDQTFFVAYGQNWCSNVRLAARDILIKTDNHSPAPVRTRAAPSLIPEFQEAFGCKTGSDMAPEKRCVIW